MSILYQIFGRLEITINNFGIIVIKEKFNWNCILNKIFSEKFKIIKLFLKILNYLIKTYFIIIFSCVIKIICNSLKRGFPKDMPRVHIELTVSNLFNDTHNIYVYTYFI